MAGELELLLLKKLFFPFFLLKVETKDALLHAINEEFVEAVEVLLDHEETIHKPGELHVSFPPQSLPIFGKIGLFLLLRQQARPTTRTLKENLFMNLGHNSQKYSSS